MKHRRFTIAVILARVAGVALVAVLAWRLPASGWVVGLADWMRGHGSAGVALFVVAYAAGVVALLPGSLFTLAAGFAYGPIGGLLVASPASVLGATAAFLLGRTVLRGWARKQISQSSKAGALDRVIGDDSFKLILLLRLSPAIPFNVLNYALGLSSASVGRYVGASFIGMLPGTWMYAYLGSLATTAAGLADASRGGGTARLTLTIAGLVATVIVIILVTRAARKALDAELSR